MHMLLRLCLLAYSAIRLTILSTNLIMLSITKDTIVEKISYVNLNLATPRVKVQ